MASNKYSVIYLKKADVQYEKTVNWYKDKSLSAAIGFVKDIYERLAIIQNDPHRYRNTYKDFHEISLEKYPYILVYKIDERNKNVFITSVHHHKQNPKRKSRR